MTVLSDTQGIKVGHTLALTIYQPLSLRLKRINGVYLHLL
jgi:hypothetical protein